MLTFYSITKFIHPETSHADISQPAAATSRTMKIADRRQGGSPLLLSEPKRVPQAEVFRSREQLLGLILLTVLFALAIALTAL
jgi:hypothetical protein